MRLIQSKILPKDWIEKVIEFDINNSSLSENHKIIAHALIQNIIEEKEKSLINPLSKHLVLHIIFEEKLLTSDYDSLPKSLIIDGFDEIKGEKGLNLARKLHSVFVEFITYKDLIEQGYEIVDFEREEGSCDLKLKKNDIEYNFEVKYKECEDVGLSRLYDCLDAYSLLSENTFLRKNIFKINLKVDNLTYSNIKSILSEINQFIENKNDVFNGEFIKIFNTKKDGVISRDIIQVSQDIEKLEIKTINNTDELIQKLFIENNGHITKLINKSKKPVYRENFVGCLVWTIPFHNNISGEEIEKSFNKVLDLDFDLFVYTGGINKDEFNFVVKSNK